MYFSEQNQVGEEWMRRKLYRLVHLQRRVQGQINCLAKSWTKQSEMLLSFFVMNMGVLRNLSVAARLQG
jgi:hypothetical protein